MPDIFKQQGREKPRGSVAIPDVSFPRLDILENEDETFSGDEDEGGFREVRMTPEEASPSDSFAPTVMSRMELAEYYRAELDDVRQEAYEQAYADAISRKKGELSECLGNVDLMLSEMQKLQRQYMAEYAQQLKYLAIEIAEKMILARIAEDDMVLSKLVMQSVSNVKNANWIDVELSQRLVTLVEYIKREIEKPEYHGRAVVTPMACADDTCRVSTEDGTVVSTISAQAGNLRQAFREAENQ